MFQKQDFKTACVSSTAEQESHCRESRRVEYSKIGPLPSHGRTLRDGCLS